MSSPGLLLGGRYRIESFIGVSELGEVYAALDLQSGRECAVKLLPAALKHVPNAWNAFQDFSRSVATLNADAVARAGDFGTDPAIGRPFVVSERIAFPSLAALVAAHGPVQPALWLQAFGAFARSLDAAAEASLVHGGIKPSNLFFAPEHPGWARISDFGMASLRAACPPASGAAPLGWTALEQTRGEPPSRAGDIFGLGLVTFYALTGRHFLSAMWQAVPDPRQVVAELEAEAVGAQAHARAQGGELPGALDPWFARALNRNQSARFASAGEAALMLAELLASSERAAAPQLAPQPSGVAAAVAAPLLFQELPRPSAGTGTGHGDAPRSSRPPGFSAPRAATTEHVAGLPTEPPVALLAAVGVGLVAALALAGFAAVRLFSRGESTKAATSAEVRVLSPPPVRSASNEGRPAPAPPTSGGEARAKTQAHFACAPVACEWIVCDGENVKKGQLELVLAPGKHSCSASRYGYRTAVTEFQIEAGKTTRVAFELLPAKAGVPAAAGPASRAGSGAKTLAKPKKTAGPLKGNAPAKGATSKPSTTTKTVASSKPTSKRL